MNFTFQFHVLRELHEEGILLAQGDAAPPVSTGAVFRFRTGDLHATREVLVKVEMPAAEYRDVKRLWQFSGIRSGGQRKRWREERKIRCF